MYLKFKGCLDFQSVMIGFVKLKRRILKKTDGRFAEGTGGSPSSLDPDPFVLKNVFGQ